MNDDFPPPVGDRLRAAREARSLSLDDVATQTRVPVRHLEAIEAGDWASLPAPTYSVGFAKSFAEAVGLDRQEIGDDVRVELGGGRNAGVVDTYEAADPGRVPPRMLAIGAFVVALMLLAGYLYWRNAALGDAQPDFAPVETVSTPRAAAPAGRAPAASGPVVITANEPVWIKVYERAGGRSLTETTLGAGQSYEVPAAAVDPLLRTGRADLLRISVGTADAPPVGPANTLVKDVSLRPEALLARQAGAAPPAPPSSTP